MGTRRALLIGVEEYGPDLVRLPSANEDVTLVGEALASCGYEVEDVSGRKEDASSLQTTLREFCEECEDDDTHLIYFSGHGTSVEGRDYVIPTGVGREQADGDEYSRVKTDLCNFVASGLVIFVIDACRDVATTKGATAFGYEAVGGPRFVRFFGCSKGEVCQVVGEGHEGRDVSLFSKAFADALLEGNNESLGETLERTTDLCRGLAGGNLRIQKPHLNHGETTADTQEMLDRRIFDPPVVPTLWERFEPNEMHCLLVTSEFESRTSPAWTLEELVGLVVKGKLGRRVWDKFREYGNERVLLNGQQRKLPKKFERIQLASFAVKDAFDDQLFDDAVRGLVEADLAIFDVTGFEPGMMLMMGIRSASRRGVSICTHGSGWRELEEIDIPFNLRGLSLGSHTHRRGGAGKNPVAEDFVNRIERGFQQLACQPRYQDLPAYDALRQLGSRYEASSTIPASERVLVLASYGKIYTESNWESFQNLLEGFLDDLMPGTKVLRLIDDGNPQLVSQSLYEQIRRTAGCVVDWTEFSPSTFFELGVRLAVSNWGAIQFVDKRYLPGEAKAKRWESVSGQIKRMRELFQPRTYELNGDEDIFREAAQLLFERNPGLDRKSMTDYDRVHRIVSDTIQDVKVAHVPVYDMLKNAADALHHPDQAEKGAPQILFRHSSRGSEQLIKGEAERAAMEARIAAWLYLHHRIAAGQREPGDPLRALHDKLGEEAATALFDAGDVELGEQILGLLEPGA